MLAVFNAGPVLEQETEYNFEPEYLLSLRGLTIGYHTAARAFDERCYENHCIHNELTEHNIDYMAFQLHQKNNFPKCDRH